PAKFLGTTNQIPNKETRKQRHPEGQYCSKHLKIFRTFDKWGQSWVKLPVKLKPRQCLLKRRQCLLKLRHGLTKP
ncbi:MAG: hypothetical protein IJ886_00510, partial [Prevotella sp.]|nr:hypothetical protein [Prevotella sp.]